MPLAFHPRASVASNPPRRTSASDPSLEVRGVGIAGGHRRLLAHRKSPAESTWTARRDAPGQPSPGVYGWEFASAGKALVINPLTRAELTSPAEIGGDRVAAHRQQGATSAPHRGACGLPFRPLSVREPAAKRLANRTCASRSKQRTAAR